MSATAQFVTDALVRAIWRRGKPDPLLHDPIPEVSIPANISSA
jgi:hypothetical protein